jgi:hypothetical protein
MQPLEAEAQRRCAAGAAGAAGARGAVEAAEWTKRAEPGAVQTRGTAEGEPPRGAAEAGVPTLRAAGAGAPKLRAARAGVPTRRAAGAGVLTRRVAEAGAPPTCAPEEEDLRRAKCGPVAAVPRMGERKALPRLVAQRSQPDGSKVRERSESRAGPGSHC